MMAETAIAGPELLVDMKTGDVLFEQDAGAPWHPASLTKLMTAYVTFEAIAEGRVSLDTVVTMTPEAVSQAPARSGLKAGDKLTLKNALYVLLVKSANDMAVAIAETVDGTTNAFADEMNATARKLGLTRTHYDNVNGLPDDGQVTTARDLAVLAIDLRRTFPQYDQIFNTHIVVLNKVNLRSDNGLLTRFAGTTGMKTGFICAAGLNIVATAHRNGRDLMAVVLGGASSRIRDQMTAQLLLRGFANEYTDRGKSVVMIANDLTSPPTDMTAFICGKKARAYVAAANKRFPMGLRGQPSYLTDKIAPLVYQASELGDDTPVGAANDNGVAQGDGEPPDATDAVVPLPRRAR